MLCKIVVVLLTIGVSTVSCGSFVRQDTDLNVGVIRLSPKEINDTVEVSNSMFPSRTHDIAMLQFTEKHRKEIERQIKADFEEEERIMNENKSVVLTFFSRYWKLGLVIAVFSLFGGFAIYCQLSRDRKSKRDVEESIELAAQ